MEDKENLVVEEEKVQEVPVGPNGETISVPIGLGLEKPEEASAEALEPVEEDSLDDLSLELEGVEEVTPLEEAVVEDPLVSEDQGKYADGFPDWNLEPPLGK